MSSLPSPFTAAHRTYVKNLYRRVLQNELNWIVQRDLWRARALSIRAEFESNRCAPIVTFTASGMAHLVPDSSSTSIETFMILVRSQRSSTRRRRPLLPGSTLTLTDVSACAVKSRVLPSTVVFPAPEAPEGTKWYVVSLTPMCLMLIYFTGNATCRYVSPRHQIELPAHLLFSTLSASCWTNLRTRTIQRGAWSGRSLIAHNVFRSPMLLLPFCQRGVFISPVHRTVQNGGQSVLLQQERSSVYGTL